MKRPPRGNGESIINGGILGKSVIQGLVIFAASFITYFVFLKNNPDNAALARTMGLVIIMLANLFLVQVNSSNHDFAIKSMVNLAKDKVMWVVNLGTIVGLIIILYTPLSGFLKLAPLSLAQLLLALIIAATSVLWYELVKLAKYIQSKN